MVRNSDFAYILAQAGTFGPAEGVTMDGHPELSSQADAASRLHAAGHSEATIFKEQSEGNPLGRIGHPLGRIGHPPGRIGRIGRAIYSIYRQ